MADDPLQSYSSPGDLPTPISLFRSSKTRKWPNLISSIAEAFSRDTLQLLQLLQLLLPAVRFHPVPPHAPGSTATGPMNITTTRMPPLENDNSIVPSTTKIR